MVLNIRWPHSHKWIAIKSSMDEHGVNLVCAKCFAESFHINSPMQRINYKVVQALKESSIWEARL